MSRELVKYSKSSRASARLRNGIVKRVHRWFDAGRQRCNHLSVMGCSSATSSPGSSPTFNTAVQNGVAEACAEGLTVTVSVQDEAGSGEAALTMLPNTGTGRVWSNSLRYSRTIPKLFSK